MTSKCLLAATAVAISIGCGSPSTPTGPRSFGQAPSPVTRTGSNTVRSNTVPASNGGAPGIDSFDIEVSRSGDATVTLTWHNGDFSLQLYVTRGTCANPTSLVTAECTILGTTRPGSLPGVITTPVVSGDVVTVWVLNQDEQGPQAFIVDLEINTSQRSSSY